MDLIKLNESEPYQRGVILPSNLVSTCVKDEQMNYCDDRTWYILSMHHLKFVPMDIAVKAVDEVFTKCYNDLEPIGRRCWDKESFRLADREKKLMGYK